MRVIFHIIDIVNDSQKFLMQVYEKSYYYTQIYLQYSNFCLSSELASLYLHCYYFQNDNVHAEVFLSPKQTILHKNQNEINTVNQLQLNYFTNIHLLIPRFINISCVITINLNTLTDVPYQMTVGGAFVYICENLVKRSR